MSGAPKIRIEDILDAVERYRPDLDEDLLRHAYVFAANRHQGQVRRSGEAYMVHPLDGCPGSSPRWSSTRSRSRPGCCTTSSRTPSSTAEELEVEFGPEVTRLVVGADQDLRLRVELLDP